MLDPTLFDALRVVPVFAELLAAREASGDDACFAFLAHAEQVRLSAGEQLAEEGQAAAFCVLLQGRLRVTKIIGGQERLLIAYGPGTFFGELPLLLGTPFLASAYAEADTHLLRFAPDGFWQMIASCPTIAQTILRTMAARVKDLEQVSQNETRLASLGTLAAGLAHELNNPAAAARRAARQGRDRDATLRCVARRLSRHALSEEQWDVLDRFADDAARHAAAGRVDEAASDPLAESEREDALSDYLSGRATQLGGAGGGEAADLWRLAPTLARAGITPECLDALAAELPARALGDALRWLDSHLATEEMWDELTGSVTRISDLVDAARSYSFLDQAPDQESVDIHAGLDATLAMLAPRLAEHPQISVVRDYSPGGLPPIPAWGGALNQVWTHLLENALDALAEQPGGDSGHIFVRTCRDDADGAILVEIADDGPGVAPELQARIFEPFFSTKGVGKGSGLGLVNTKRIVAQHGGEIRLDSAPGRGARFTVRFPVATNNEV